MKRVYLLVLVMIGIVNIICNKHTVLAEKEYPNSYTIGDYCNYERRAYIKYRTYAFDTTLDTLEEILEDAYWLMRNNSYFGMPTGKALVIGEEGEAVSALIKENESEWIDRAYYGLAKDMPNKMDMTYMSPVDFAKLDWDSYDFSVYDFIILEDSSRDVELTYEQYSWLIELTATSRYIIADKDMVDDYFVWDSDYDRVSCSYNPADQILTVFADPFDKNNIVDSQSKAIEIYNNQLKLNTLGSSSEDEYQFSYSDVREIRWIGNSSLPMYALTPFENLTAFMFLPDGGIKQVGAHAFENLKHLEYVELSNATLIDDYAMFGTGITELSGENLISIGSHAFENCKDLVTISTSDSLTSIGEGAFKNSGITEMTIPQTVTTLRAQTFYDCRQLDCISIALPENGLTVYTDVFENVADDCRIIWDFGDGDNIYYNLLPFDVPSYEVDIYVLQDYSNKEYTITKGERVRKEYTITFDANGGECDVESMIVEEGGIYENLPVPTREGFEFVGWIDVDGNVYKDGEKVDVENDIIIIANWKSNSNNDDKYMHTEENTIWNFDTTSAATNAHKEVRKISNTTLPMKPIYMLNNFNTGYYYSNGKKIDLKDKTFVIKDENNADFLFRTINSSKYNDKILWITSKESYKKCKKHANSMGKTVINSGLTNDELKRAITVMHCKYFQYLLYIQTPYTETEAELNSYKKSNLHKDMMNVKDWEDKITYPNKGDVYPVKTSVFNKYYSYCKGINDALDNLLDTKFSFDSNTTVVDAILALNEYVMEETGYDYNYLHNNNAAKYLINDKGKLKIEVAKGKTVEVEMDKGYIKTKAGNDYIEEYLDENGEVINTHRIYDLKWFLKDTYDTRNPKKTGEKKHGVCQSYSKFVAAIMGKCGYEVRIVSGLDSDEKYVHVFNKLNIDNKVYYCDLTDGYNKKYSPCDWLFLTEEEIKKKDNNHNPYERQFYNGKKISIGKELDYHNLAFDACGGKMVIEKNGNRFATTYYELIVNNNLKFSDVLKYITVRRRKYVFKGWYTSEDGGERINIEDLVKRNQKIFAQWDKVKVKKEEINKIKLVNGIIKIKFKKYSGVDNYYIQISKRKDFNKTYCKKYTVDGNKNEITTEKYDRGTYYVRVRAMQKDSCGDKIYGKWSKVQKVKVK